MIFLTLNKKSNSTPNTLIIYSLYQTIRKIISGKVDTKGGLFKLTIINSSPYLSVPHLKGRIIGLRICAPNSAYFQYVIRIAKHTPNKELYLDIAESKCCILTANKRQQLSQAAVKDLIDTVDKLKLVAQKLKKTALNLNALVDLLDKTEHIVTESTDPELSPNFKLKLVDLINRDDLRTGVKTSTDYYEDLFYMSKLTGLKRSQESDILDKSKKLMYTESLDLVTMQDTENAQSLGSSTQNHIHSSLDDKTFLDDFFLRPVLIDSFNVDLRTPIDRVLRPWELWSRNANVRSKLSHHAYFRGNLKLRFNIATTKFHYGALIASNQPLCDINDTYLTLKTYSTNSIEKRLSAHNYLSQSPEHCYIRAGQDDDVSLSLPFINPNNSLRLFNEDEGVIINNTISYKDFFDMGEVYISSIAEFQCQDDSELVIPRLTIYAWMEDVELSTPTSTRIDILSESEYSTNPISTIATSISHAAESLEDIPFIAPFAHATKIATGVISKVAKFFGFSRPLQLEPATHTKTITFTNGATTSGRDMAYKLSCDPKQELSLMNDLCGGGTDDPLAIKHLTSRPTLIDSSIHNGFPVPYTTPLLEFPITPMLGTRVSTGTLQHVQYSALATAAMHFNFWRGTITYRFDVTAPNFARGKLIFIYEPNAGATYADRRSRPTLLNQQYIATMDLEKERSITIHVGFNHHRNFAYVYRDGDGNFFDGGIYPIDYSNAAGFIIEANKEGQSTGALIVKNATTISGLSTTNGLYIHTYVSSDDIEFSEPADLTNENVNMISESAYTQGEPLNMVATKQKLNVKISGPEYLINKTIPSNENIFKAHFGEKIESLRVLLKRDQACFSFPAQATTNTIFHPVYPPLQSLLYPSTPADQFTDIGRVNTFNMLRFCYLGVRGGMRYRIYSTQDGFAPPVAIQFRRSNNFGVTSSATPFESDKVTPNASGGIVQSAIHGGIEYEVPYKESQLFDFPCSIKSIKRFNVTPSRSSVSVNSFGNTGAKVFMCSIAEDFNFLRFQGGNAYRVKNSLS
jgi:hypothetical protein